MLIDDDNVVVVDFIINVVVYKFFELLCICQKYYKANVVVYKLFELLRICQKYYLLFFCIKSLLLYIRNIVTWFNYYNQLTNDN